MTFAETASPQMKAIADEAVTLLSLTPFTFEEMLAVTDEVHARISEGRYLPEAQK